MSRFEWTPNVERQVLREAEKKIGATVDRVVRRVRCDVHPDFQIHLERQDGHSVMVACCQSGAEKAGSAARIGNIAWKIAPESQA